MQSSTNGCCHAPSHTEAGSRIAGVLGPKPKIEPDNEAGEFTAPYGAEPTGRAGFYDSTRPRCSTWSVRERTVERSKYAPDDPIGVMTVMWSEYRDLMSMRDRIAAITGGFQPKG